MSPDLKRELTEAGQAARDRQDRRDGPRPGFAENLSGSLRHQLDLRADAMASDSRRGAVRPVPRRALALTGLVLALLVSGLAWAGGFLQPPRDTVAASHAAVPTVAASASAAASPRSSAADGATSSPSTSIEATAAPTASASASASPSASPSASAPASNSTPQRPSATPAPPTSTPAATPTPQPTTAPTPAGIVDMGALSVADNLDLTVTFSWNAYSGSGLTAYAVFYELSSSGLTPSYPTSTAWATAGASKTSVTVPGIPAGDYQVRAQALCSPSGPLVVCGQTNVVHVHLSASRGASLSPTP
jgi:hypothetical protein